LFDKEISMAKQFPVSTLEMALIGYETELRRIVEAIQEIRNQLKQRTGRTAAGVEGGAPKSRRPMTAAAKRRIALAQKKRWAAFHARAKAKTPAPPKRVISEERRAALSANLAKARAARAAKRAGK
jgi:hypothetical protein